MTILYDRDLDSRCLGNDSDSLVAVHLAHMAVAFKHHQLLVG